VRKSLGPSTQKAIQAPLRPLARLKSFASVGVSPPNLFLSFFPSSGRGIAVRGTASFHSPMPGIHAELTLAQRTPPALGRGSSAWTTGSKSLGDESESGLTVAWHSSGAKARRENEIFISSLPGMAVRGTASFHSPMPAIHAAERDENLLGNSTRGEHQALVTQVEERFGYFDESEMARSWEEDVR